MPNQHVPNYRIKENSNGKLYAYVALNGKRIGLGADGPEAREKYHSLISEWLVCGRFLPIGDADITIKEMCARFLIYAKDYYANSTELVNYKTVIKFLVTLYGNITANNFGPQKLEAVRHTMTQKGWQRSSINKQVMRVRAIFKWAEAKEIITRGMYEHLSTLAPLKKGRCPGVPEGKKVKPALVNDIEAVKPYVSRQVWAMIQLQLLTGARPGEIVLIKAEDIDRTEDVWIFKPEKHKKDYLDIEREIFLGSQAQAIVARFMLNRRPEEYLFSPIEANFEAKQKNARSSRRIDQIPNPKTSSRVIGKKYTVDSYRRAIQRACEAAKVKNWSPNQLRHNAATTIRKQYGIEAAQVILGHASADITQVYAERDRAKAIDIAARIG